MFLNLGYIQVLAVNTDNMTSNEEAFASMENSFVLEHCIHCFNHTLQLSAKTLLCPFNAGLGKATEDDDNNDIDDLLDLDINNKNDKDGDDEDEEGGEKGEGRM